MKSAARWILLIASVVLLVFVCGFTTEPAQNKGAAFIVTATPAYEPLAALRGGERFPKGAQLLLVRDEQAEPLVKGFFASADASVSFDAKSVLFAGKQTTEDKWQVWEMQLADGSVRKVIGGATDVVRPLYLPDNHLVFARRTERGFELETAKFDGTAVVPISFLGASALPANVLADGRILFEAGYPLGSGATPELFLVYQDGSGVESYRCDHPSAQTAGRWGGRQMSSGDVVFTQGMKLARFTSSLASEAPVTAPRSEYAGAPVEVGSGSWMLSARSGTGARFEVKLLKPGAQVMQTLLARVSDELVEPVPIVKRAQPKRHPSALHDWSYGNLLALDARVSREGDLGAAPRSVRLETQDDKGQTIALGTAPVEADGSFFLKAPGDRPIRFAVLDEKGATVRAEHGWFWIRRGEQRYCVGCHAGPERAPENRVPAVLVRTTTPVDLTGAASAETAQHAQSGGK